MYTTYDYYCPACDITKEYFVDRHLKDEQLCDLCNADMIRTISATYAPGLVKGSTTPVKR